MIMSVTMIIDIMMMIIMILTWRCFKAWSASRGSCCWPLSADSCKKNEYCISFNKYSFIKNASGQS